MTVQDAIDIRERAITAGLADCCDECRAALEMLAKLGSTTHWTMASSSVTHPSPTYAREEHRAPTLGLGTEEAARYLRRQIAKAA
jgi:hypothetical protein